MGTASHARALPLYCRPMFFCALTVESYMLLWTCILTKLLVFSKPQISSCWPFFSVCLPPSEISLGMCCLLLNNLLPICVQPRTI